MKNLYLIEYYEKDPITGTEGWTIHFAWVYANISAEAREKVAQAPNFDCVITCGEQAEITPLHMKRTPLVIA